MSQSEALSRDERARILNEQRHMREALVSVLSQFSFEAI